MDNEERFIELLRGFIEEAARALKSNRINENLLNVSDQLAQVNS